MAGIDKTYTDSYDNYKEFKSWADSQIVTFFNGHKECIGDWVWQYNKQDFENGKIPIMNTPTWIDIYLIQNCKSDFILERMKEVYSSKAFSEFQGLEFPPKLPDDFKQNRKVIIKPLKDNSYFIHNKPFGGKMSWWLQAKSLDWSYNDESKTWTARSIYYPTYTNTAHIKTLKGVVRHLRKQFLPKGLEFRLIGRYEGEEYKILIK
jgi:hypothetical protein